MAPIGRHSWIPRVNAAANSGSDERRHPSDEFSFLDMKIIVLFCSGKTLEQVIQSVKPPLDLLSK